MCLPSLSSLGGSLSRAGAKHWLHDSAYLHVFMRPGYRPHKSLLSISSVCLMSRRIRFISLHAADGGAGQWHIWPGDTSSGQ